MKDHKRSLLGEIVTELCVDYYSESCLSGMLERMREIRFEARTRKPEPDLRFHEAPRVDAAQRTYGCKSSVGDAVEAEDDSSEGDADLPEDRVVDEIAAMLRNKFCAGYVNRLHELMSGTVAKDDTFKSGVASCDSTFLPTPLAPRVDTARKKAAQRIMISLASPFLPDSWVLEAADQLDAILRQRLSSRLRTPWGEHHGNPAA